MTDVIQEHIKSLEQRLATEPQSPLFARLASLYLQAGRASDALRLCDDGLAIYPFYSTAHLVKGKALVELGMMAEAKHEYVVVYELLPTNETLARLVSSINMGSSVELGVAPADRVALEPEAMAASPADEVALEPEATAALPAVGEADAEEPQALVAEEILQQEPPFEEESFVVTEPVTNLEPPTAQSDSVEAAPLAEDSFGFHASPVIEEDQLPPSGYETPGFGLEDKPQPLTSDADFSATSEATTVAPASIEEHQASATDYGFGIPEETLPVEPVAEEAPSVPEMVDPLPFIATEDAFGVPIETPPAPLAVEPTLVAEPPIALTPPISEPATEEAPSTKEAQTPDWFEAFSQLQQPTAETTEAPPTAPAEEENPFAMFEADQAPAATEGEPYEEFAARVRMELSGTDDTVTLDQYLASSSSTEPLAAPDPIGELAEKLKSSPRITPPVINYSEKAMRSATDGEVSSGSGFVTPTLAEIYVKQGWFNDAIKAYRALVLNKPAEKEKFDQRIAEIEEMKKKQ